MNAKSLLVISALAIAAGTATADDSSVRSSQLSRAEVKQAVQSARAAGLLIPAGEGQIRLPHEEAQSNLSRADVKRDSALLCHAIDEEVVGFYLKHGFVSFRSTY